MDELDHLMLDEKIGVNNTLLKREWDNIVNQVLSDAKISRPKDSYMMTGSKRGLHTELLGKMLAEMQYLPRAYPNAKW